MTDYEKLLSYINPDCPYDEWIRVGMALKTEGAPFQTWDEWSSRGSKYNAGEMLAKWNGFRRDDVTGGTLFHIACQYGFTSAGDDPMAGHYDLHNLLLDEVHLDPVYGSVQKVPDAPNNYDGRGEMLEYLTTLFEEDEYVGFCAQALYDQKKDKWRPAGTVYGRTAGQIIRDLKAGRTGFGTPNEAAGIWIRFNPLDGQGENDTNVTRWKHCLLESDDIPLEQQWSLIQSMHLPCTFVIHSGGKSLHAIVRIDAENAQQYRQRVNDLYEYAEKAGFKPDPQDKNASRLSRIPGAKRGTGYQYIVARNIGEKSYLEWMNWRQEQADDLPEDITLADVWNDPPQLKDELIPGILRIGHKMLISGPSKAGKSFLLMNLAISMAEGVDWLGMKCRQGKVCYVNLELDSASCIHRFKEIYYQRGIDPDHIAEIDVWNLRGHAVPMDRLAPILIHRFKDKQYEAIIIDPIYKVITGDENSATEMSQFCSYFDRVATEMNVAMIYCHHHSKGAIDKYDNAMDRSSGSGVFARDPDAILDMTEVKTDGCEANYRSLKGIPEEMVLTGWEFSATLREFPPMPHFRVWFHYPVHELDENGDLKSAAKNRGSGKGVGKGQTAKSDLYNSVRDTLDARKSISGDTAITLEEAGGRKGDFRPDTDFECATIRGEQFVHYRLEDEIYIKGRRYYRKKHGNGSQWEEDPEPDL
ncbi:MAG: AAA family ATPase [Clostridia bacterium]|nr:AAA family ATPase [Clostridia bacterium]